jgi:uncharacterized membrane protein YjjP (DUF1212 family)
MNPNQIARLVVSLVLLSLAALLIYSNPEPPDYVLASTIIGVVGGYWLHRAERTL